MSGGATRPSPGRGSSRPGTRGRRHEACGAVRATRMLQRGRRRTTPPRRAAARHRPRRVQLDADFDEHVVRPTWPLISAAGRRTRASSATVSEVRPAGRSGRDLGFDALATATPRIGRTANGRYTLGAAAIGRRTRAMSSTAGYSAGSPRPVPGGRDHQGRRPWDRGRIGLRTAAKPDSQDVCSSPSTVDASSSSEAGSRSAARRGRHVRHASRFDRHVELVTTASADARPAGRRTERFVVDVDHAEAIVTVGSASDLVDAVCG